MPMKRKGAPMPPGGGPVPPAFLRRPEKGTKRNRSGIGMKNKDHSHPGVISPKSKGWETRRKKYGTTGRKS